MQHLQTKNGYNGGEVLSSLQKAIRRGQENEALYWALELCPMFEPNLWIRLIVIAYEDISMVVPGEIPATISQLREEFYALRDLGNPTAASVLANAITTMCRAEKSRVADNLIIVAAHKIDNSFSLALPAFDANLPEETFSCLAWASEINPRKKKRRVQKSEILLSERQTKNGQAVIPVINALEIAIGQGKEEEAFYWALELADEYEVHLWTTLTRIAYESLPGNAGTTISRAKKDYFKFRELGNSAAVLCISNAVLKLCRTPKINAQTNLNAIAARLDEGLTMEVPDHALDKHTARGRKLGRGGKHFAEVAAILNPEAEGIDCYKEEANKILTAEITHFPCLVWAGEKRKGGKTRIMKEEQEIGYN